MSSACPPTACGSCSSLKEARLKKLGIKVASWDYVVALAGNPNTGKSTIFNNLTGLRQHTGNWPGKTIARAEGGYAYGEKRYKIVDLPGTYSLLSTSPEEEVARDFILFGQPDVTIVVVDATALERNLNLALQIAQITDRAVLALNLMDEARAHGIEIDARGLARDLGMPVVPMAARQGEGMAALLKEVAAVASGEVAGRPLKIRFSSKSIASAVKTLADRLARAFPALRQTDWIAMRLLEGDARIEEAVTSGEIGELQQLARSGSSVAVNASAVAGAAGKEAPHA